MSMTTLSPQQLRQAADLKEKIQELQQQFNAVLAGADLPGSVGSAAPVSGEVTETPGDGRRKKRAISAEGRARISAAQKARWAANRIGKPGAKAAPEIGQVNEKPKRTMTPAWRKALVRAREARLAKLGVKVASKPEVSAKTSKGGRSPAWRKAKSEAMKAMWAARRRGSKAKL
jgi:hypothetical protein